ncbi:MAG: glycosyltransferase family 39 protein [Acidobacteria bacterium]|nr:glycosyltransferase family 39 protein [Acidobacteriota bacterium]
MNNSSGDSVQHESTATKADALLPATAEVSPEAQTNAEISRPGEARRRWLKPQLRQDARLVGMILAIKALCMVFAVQSFHVWADQPVKGWHGWLEVLNRWDAVNYLKMAEFGYHATGEMRPMMVFYPLYPWLISLLTFVTRDHLVSAFLISTVASLAVGLLLFRLVALDYPAEIAERTVWFLFIFPTSYFLHIGYTESLFLALALGCFLMARRQDWASAGCLGALACMARGPGILLIPTLAVEALSQYRATRRWRWQWLWIIVIASGFGVYLWINAREAGNPFAFMQIRRENFYISMSWPWVGIQQTIGALGHNPAAAEMSGRQELIFIALGLVGAIVSWIKLRPTYSTWITLNWLIITCVSFIASVPRYTLVMFPLHLLFAQLAAKSRVGETIITVWSLLFLALFISAFARGFWAY